MLMFLMKSLQYIIIYAYTWNAPHVQWRMFTIFLRIIIDGILFKGDAWKNVKIVLLLLSSLYTCLPIVHIIVIIHSVRLVGGHNPYDAYPLTREYSPTGIAVCSSASLR